ncbi:type II toxin-antitoxin system RelE/ParE family toxin [Chamaesiphon sp.]|uniref:type II toxin-antitoxin system RelE/ParE family toxin n=1 Tax=Chamaesiphon sp. TaxID=2814140 RepID=UPI003593E3AF
MNYRLIIRPEAELDLEDAFTWYESQETGLGSKFVRAIDNYMSTIGRNPLEYRLIYQFELDYCYIFNYQLSTIDYRLSTPPSPPDKYHSASDENGSPAHL